MEIVLSPTPRTRRYRIESATRVAQVGSLLEYHEVAEVELTLLGTDQASRVFRLATQSVEIQSNNDVFTWARDVNTLLDNLVLRVGLSGHIEEVLNQTELLNRWPAHKLMLQQTYGARTGADSMLTALENALQTPAFVAKHLTSGGLYDFLFPGLYLDYPEGVLPWSKVLAGFFGRIDLPLTLSKQLIRSDSLSQLTAIKCSGQLNESQFDKVGFRRFLKDAADAYDIETALSVDYETIYQLDAQGWPEAAEMFLTADAGGAAYEYTLGRQLTLLS